MRVVGGELGGRRLRAPQGRNTRPTSDRVREAMFSSLGHSVGGAHVLDLYAGSGALGIEALSRGAAAAVFVERAASAAKVVRANLRSLDLHAPVIVADVSAFARGHDGPSFDVVFADPPYGEPFGNIVGTLQVLFDRGHLAPGAHIVVERDRRSAIGLGGSAEETGTAGGAGAPRPSEVAPVQPEGLPGWLVLQRRRAYGDTVLLYLRIHS